MHANLFKTVIATLALLAAMSFISCNSKPQANTTNTTVTENCDSNLQISANDKSEIEKLFRDMIYWSFNDTVHINLLPVLTDENDSIYIGFDFEELEITAQELKNTGFFSQTFIDNYKRLITELDRKIRNNEFEEWLVGDLPTFKFANDVGPFCNCQGIVPVDSMNFINEDFENVEAEGIAKWIDILGKTHIYGLGKCKFEKEQEHWKISYMSGFDYDDGIKRDGEIE